MSGNTWQPWWQGEVAYQIYPRSFCDSNGDGLGDLRGIIGKLDYLKSLGVGLVWLSPIYASPGVDNGYDISDYRAIDPRYGTLQDFDELIRGARERGIRVILDLVVNHCSSEHPLFKAALSNPTGPEAQCFYFVRGRAPGVPPDNLRSYFGGSVWEPVPGYADLYYLHYFARQQPDLNWENPVLRERVYDMITWWLRRGVAGFRLDAIMNLCKDLTFPGLEADDIDGLAACARMTERLSEKTLVRLEELKRRAFMPQGAFTVAEAFGVHQGMLPALCGPHGVFSCIFDFTVREIFEHEAGYYAYPEPSVALYREGNFAMQQRAGRDLLIAPILENHDEPRAASFYRRAGQEPGAFARALGTCFMFLKGLPFIYQGQELGLTNTRFDSLGEFNDLLAHDEYRKCLAHGLDARRALEILNVHARDHARTPMPWDGSPGAGFTSGTPWLKLHQDHRTLNVRAQEDDPHSTLNYYRALIHLRKQPELRDSLVNGEFKPWGDSAELIAYRRVGEHQQALCAANFSDREQRLRLPDGRWRGGISCADACLARGARELRLPPLGAALVISDTL